MVFTSEEKAILNVFFTNTDKDIFAVRPWMPEQEIAILFARYSRNPKDLRRTFLDELYVKSDVLQKVCDVVTTHPELLQVDHPKTRSFFKKFLQDFGHNSVAELGTGHIAVEGVSNIVTKILERRLVSPLEKSTRYVWFDQNSLFMEPTIMKSSHATRYQTAVSGLMSTYQTLIDPMIAFLHAKHKDDPAIARQLAAGKKPKILFRPQACDVLRYLLPGATQTNVGITGHARALDTLIVNMLSQPLQESRDVARDMHDELKLVLPYLIAYSSAHFDQGIDNGYFAQTPELLNDLAKEIIGVAEDIPQVDPVELVYHDPDGEDKVIAAMLYDLRDMHLPKSELLRRVKAMSETDKDRLVDTFFQHRVQPNLFNPDSEFAHQPLRALEDAIVDFDVLMDYGAYRDLQRHRAGTYRVQRLTTLHGYDVPEQIIDAGFEQIYREVIEQAADAHNIIHADLPEEAQYVVPFAFKVRYNMRMNLRSAFYMVELRTKPGGHISYRKIAKDMADHITQVYPRIGKQFHMILDGLDEGSISRVDAKSKE
ncbi:hypothetical protein HN587_05275 [Candidatus Woesearchaeota archaeon]|jgi:thymidylate synthase ThyX|nr:hypothetical protein [Candidatus Woesearchaeota archaeon]